MLDMLVRIGGKEFYLAPEAEEPLPEPPNWDGVWYWLYPDQFYMPPEAVRSNDPAVVRFGGIENPDLHGQSIPLTKEWQLFQLDLFALSEYGVHWQELVPDLNIPRSSSPEYDFLAQAWRGTYGSTTALTNWPPGEPRRDYVARPPQNLDREYPVYDQVRGMATNSYKAEKAVNSKGQQMLRIFTFVWEDGPPTGYGLEILDDPRVGICTIQYGGGVVNKFPRLTGDVPYPLIARRDEPVYCYAYKFQEYEGMRRLPYYRPSLMARVSTYLLRAIAKVMR